MYHRASASSALEASPTAPINGHDGIGRPTGPGSGHGSRPNGLGAETPHRSEGARRHGNTVCIVIAEDRPIVRDGLRRLIESQPGLRVTGESSVGEEVVKLTCELRPDILLLDLGPSPHSGLQVLSHLQGLRPPTPILVLVEVIEARSILKAFCLGAHGVVCKGSPREVLLKSIRSVVAGEYWLNSESVSIIVGALRKAVLSDNGANGERDYGLTQRELKIVEKVASGSSNRETSEEFNISERTVKHHLTNIFDKLGISSRVELAVFALEHGLVNRE